MSKKITILILGWIVLLLSLNKLSFYALPDISSYELPHSLTVPLRFWIVPLLNFDGRNYLTIVQSGYSSIENINHMDLRVFFPLYPLLIRIFSLNLLLNPIIIGLLISILFFIGSIVLLCYFARKSKVSESKTVLALLLFPVSFYFITYYTESLSFLNTCNVLLPEQKKMLYAACVVALATATRITGLALLPVVAWEVYVRYRDTKKISWAFLVAPLGIFLYMTYLQTTTGDALLFLHGHDTWEKPYGLLGPFHALFNGLIQSIRGVYTPNPYSHFIVVLEFITIISLILVTIFSYKKLPRSQWIYMASSVALILFSGVLFSVMRYALVIFPLYLYIGGIRSKAIFTTLIISFAILLIILSSLYFRNYSVA